MKLLCISRKHPPSVGGMQAMNYEIIRRLALQTNATVIKWGHSQLFLPFFLVWAIIRSITLLPERRRPDAIYLGDALLAPLGLLLKLILRRPAAVTAHGRDLTFRFPFYRTKVGFSLRRLDMVIAVSRHTTELCLGMGISADRYVTINNGATPEDHVPLPEDIRAAECWLSERGLSANRPILITVGRLVRRKGVSHFIETAFPLLLRAHPELLYVVVGEGRERKAIEAAASRPDISGSVLVPGRIAASTLRGLMGLAKVFVMPNIPVKGDVEGFGLVALEAGCAGLPVVASDLEGIRDAIEDGVNGYLVPPGRPERFAEIVDRLLSNERERKEAGARAREYNARHHTWDARAADYLVEFRKLSRR